MEFLPFLAIIFVFVLLVWLPASRRRKEFQQIQSVLEPGLKVMLTSGIHGTLLAVHDATIEIEVSPGVVLTVARHAVGQVVEQSNAPVDEAPEGLE